MTSHVQDPIKTVSHTPYNIPVRNELLCFLTDLDGLLKSRDITLLTKVSIVKVMAFPVVTYRCESWTIKKAECRKFDGFELRYWRSFLRVTQTARRSNQSILKEINPEYSWEGLILKLQYSGHLIQRSN